MSYGNRGKMLERAVLELFKSYASRGIFCQQNHPQQLHDGTLIHNHGFDFEVLYKNKFYAFDAKECTTARWNLATNAKVHQVKALADVESNGGIAFFLVYFTNSKQLIRFDVGVVREALTKGIKSLQPTDGQPTTLNFLGIE